MKSEMKERRIVVDKGREREVRLVGEEGRNKWRTSEEELAKG